jgi:hypothetical protein
VTSARLAVLAAFLFVAPVGVATAAPTAKRAAVAPANRIDILRWPAYQGATLLQQVSLSAREIQALAKHGPAEARAHLRGLKQVVVAEYRLASGTELMPVVAFYEPRVLAAGYKTLVKDFSEPDEVSVVYTGPGDHFVVISVEREGEGGGTLEIVAVEGPLGSLAGVGDAMKSIGRQSAEAGAKAAPRR